MTVTVAMLRKRLLLVNDKTPVNLVTGDQDLERMVEGRMLQFIAVYSDTAYVGDRGKLVLQVSARKSPADTFNVKNLYAAMRGLDGDAPLELVSAGRVLKSMLSGVKLRIANAYPNTTGQGLKEFTFEIGLED